MPAKKVAVTEPAVVAQKMPAPKKTVAKIPAAKVPVAAKKAANKVPVAPKKAAVKKTAAKAVAVLTQAGKAAVPAEPAAPAGTRVVPQQPTRDQVSHAAYLIFLRRKQLGLAGDSATDWLEAERQLGLV